ncbi:MAG: hypothetical protein A2Y40_04325 [Candidatus Margulisbacteria bacterium GWF2_35_9]|nr:MAG: hypothetical protein A2Y40_04325 [Candidatus Margulisbacteria bacterium GWF2_35_9]
MSIYLSILILLVGLIILSFSADMLIDSSISLAKHLKLSTFIIGLSVIAFGTSLPEFMVSVLALIQGSTEISIGNILGSNIANIALIVGWTGMFFAILLDKSDKKQILGNITFSMLVYFVFILLSMDGLLSHLDGAILLLFFVIFLFTSFKSGVNIESIPDGIKYKKLIAIILTTLSIVGLLIGGKLMTSSAIYIANILHIKEYVIGATIIAIGTSLPEIAASFSAIKKGETGMCFANIVGSNIFNILMVLGTVALFFSIKIDFVLLKIDFIVMVFTMVMLYVTIRLSNIIPKAIILSFIGIYIFYLIHLIHLAKIS